MSKKPTKAHVICHILAASGPMIREDILVAVSKVEGKPYKSGSNGSYFQPFNDPHSYYRRIYKAHRQSLVAMGLIQIVGKQGNNLVYGLTPLGASKAADYLAMTAQS